MSLVLENHKPHIVVIGGGAAGFFYAINKAIQQPEARITILEKTDRPLEKVVQSGGGRCNVTHHCFEPRELVKNYPRGNKELISPFYSFHPQHTIDWFAERGISIVAESDGRMFPHTNDSQTIVDCFMNEAKKHHISIRYKAEVDSIAPEGSRWHIKTSHHDLYTADKIFIATGSSLRMWKILERMGYQIAPPVPSLFTFTIKDELLQGLQGVAVTDATVAIADSKLSYSGAVLITHWGLSGPAVLKLSAFGASLLHERKYNFTIHINWTGDQNLSATLATLQQCKHNHPKKNIANIQPFALPVRLWQRMVQQLHLSEKRWADSANEELEQLAKILVNTTLHVTGKSTYKDEFVTCGGVDLTQINLKTYESKLHPNIFLGGEVLNVDAITGGFNFQHAWTSAWIAARH